MKTDRPFQTLIRHDSRGVSPVIGVILMVAITVILAALVGSFVLDIGQSAKDDSPQASFSVSVDPATDVVELRHLGGDRLSHDRTRVVVESDGTTTFEAVDSGSGALSVGKSALITLNDSGNDDSLDFDGDGTDVTSTDGDAGSFAPDDRVTVTLIDTGTERVIFERTVLVEA